MSLPMTSYSKVFDWGNTFLIFDSKDIVVFRPGCLRPQLCGSGTDALPSTGILTRFNELFPLTDDSPFLYPRGSLIYWIRSDDGWSRTRGPGFPESRRHDPHCWVQIAQDEIGGLKVLSVRKKRESKICIEFSSLDLLGVLRWLRSGWIKFSSLTSDLPGS